MSNLFNPLVLKPIKFKSNPPFTKEEVVTAASFDDNGSPVTTFVRQPKSNRSPFEGIHYSAETMSLRAKLNLGVVLTPVSIGQLENDPAKIMDKALKLDYDISQRIQALESQSFTSVEPRRDAAASVDNNDISN